MTVFNIKGELVLKFRQKNQFTTEAYNENKQLKRDSILLAFYLVFDCIFDLFYNPINEQANEYALKYQEFDVNA